MLAYFQNGQNRQVWAAPKPGTRNTFQVSYMGGSNLSVWAIYTAISCAIAGSWMGNRVAGCSTCTLIWGAQYCKKQFNLLCYNISAYYCNHLTSNQNSFRSFSFVVHSKCFVLTHNLYSESSRRGKQVCMYS